MLFTSFVQHPKSLDLTSQDLTRQNQTESTDNFSNFYSTYMLTKRTHRVIYESFFFNPKLHKNFIFKLSE